MPREGGSIPSTTISKKSSAADSLLLRWRLPRSTTTPIPPHEKIPTLDCFAKAQLMAAALWQELNRREASQAKPETEPFNIRCRSMRPAMSSRHCLREEQNLIDLGQFLKTSCKLAKKDINHGCMRLPRIRHRW